MRAVEYSVYTLRLGSYIMVASVYRAMLWLRRARCCSGESSVRPSVCL